MYKMPRFKFFVVLAIMLTPSAVFYSQSVEAAEKKKNREINIPPEIEILITDTYYVPAEFAIEILLQVIKSPKIPNNKKKEILLTAYRRLDEVQQPTRKKLVLDGTSTDTRQSLLSKSFAQKLDAVSLRSKIFKELIKLDKKKVRELIFQNQPEFSFQAVTCESALDYEVEDFYEVLTAVAKESFTADEKKRNVRLYALNSYVQNIKSSSQIAPIGTMILSLDLTSAELAQLILSYSFAVKNFSTTDRSFFISFLNSLKSFEDLLELSNRKNIHKEILTDSFRSYITKHFRGERCADNTQSYEVFIPSTIKWLNQNRLAAAPLSNEDVKFEKLSNSAAIDDFWKTGTSRDLLDKLKNLRFDMSVAGSESEEPVLRSKEDKQQIEWKEKFAQTLNELENWNGENEKNEAVYFHQKCILYRGLINVAGEKSERATVLESYEKFLSNTSFQKENRIEWFLHSAELIKFAKESVKKEDDFEFRLLANSKNPVFRIYADLMKTEAK